MKQRARKAKDKDVPFSELEISKDMNGEDVISFYVAPDVSGNTKVDGGTFGSLMMGTEGEP
jgi:hypothetical protein